MFTWDLIYNYQFSDECFKLVKFCQILRQGIVLKGSGTRVLLRIAIVAVNRFPGCGYEGDLGGFATRKAGGFIHLSGWTIIPFLLLLTSISTTLRTTFRFIVEAARLIE